MTVTLTLTITISYTPIESSESGGFGKLILLQSDPVYLASLHSTRFFSHMPFFEEISAKYCKKSAVLEENHSHPNGHFPQLSLVEKMVFLNLVRHTS